MEKPDINLLSEDRRDKKHHKKSKYSIKRIIVSIIIFTVIVLTVFSSSILFSDESLIKNLAKLNLFQQVGRLIGSQEKTLRGEADDRINILLLGIGGKSHEGGTLADTIILASYKPSTKQVAMVSLPRDLSIPTERYGWIKVNAIHAYAESNEEGEGGEAMVTALSDLLETPIHYYAVVDFTGFEKVIDEFGGVDIEVARDLIDYKYPVKGKEYIYPLENRYETLRIEAGLQHMDGSLALKYARSRHGIGIEGSDFARSDRQQRVISAVKGKILTVSTLFNPKRLNSLLKAYNEHIVTDMEIWEMIKLAGQSKSIDTANIINKTFSDAPGDLLYADMINGAYVLLPHSEDYTDIKNLWQYIFYTQEPVVTDEPEAGVIDIGPDGTEVEPNDIPSNDGEPALIVKPSLPSTTDYRKEGATIEVQNGTWTSGLAGKEKTVLEDLGFKVVAATNAYSHDHVKNLIYKLSSDDLVATAKQLSVLYNTGIIEVIPDTVESSADFVVVLGTE